MTHKAGVSTAHRIRIGIDGSPLADWGGIRRFVFEICKELDQVFADARFFIYAPCAVALPQLSQRWSVRLDNRPRGPLWLTRWLLLRARVLSDRDKLDVFWAAGALAPRLPHRLHTVITVHDLNYKLVPETMPRTSVLMHRLLYPSMIRRARLITTNSQGTADRVLKFFGRSAAAVIRPGISASFSLQPPHQIEICRAKYNLPPGYILGVGTWEPRKRLDLLISAFLSMRSEGLLNHALVLAGNRGWKDGGLQAAVRRAAPGSVIPLGYVPDDDLAALYSGCKAFVFPSIYEGFGIPVLEARACGAPVVTTDIPELRESGGPEAIYISPTREGIREGILKALAGSSGADRTLLPGWTDGAQTLARVLRLAGNHT